MATREGTRASMEFVCICIVPDFCKSPTIVVPYKIYSKFDCAVNFSTNVRFRTRWAFRHNSRLSTVLLDEPGVGGGVLSGVNKGFCRPIDGTASTTVRVNGSFVDYHEGTYMWMNCAGPEGPFNTIGRVKFLGNLLPGPVTPSGKIPKGCILGDSGILADIQSSLGDVDDLIKKGKKLYELAKTDWSDPSAVLGAMGGLAGIAGLQETAGMLEKAKKLYDTGKKVLKTDWSDPKQALAAVAGVANVAGMDGIAKAAEMASKIRDVIKTDWSDPKAALAAATTIMKSTGLNTMAAGLLSDAITSSPSSGGPKLPPFFPKQGTNSNSNGSASSANQTPDKSGGPIPKSPEGNPRLPITTDNLDAIKDKFPLAHQRIMDIQQQTGSLPANAFLEITKPLKGKDGKPVSENERIAVYIPGEGFSTTQHERDSSSLWTLPDGIRKFFVAGSGPSVGEFFGMQQKEGNWYLFGGLMDLGSPELPGAGAGGNAWWIPDKIFGMDFSNYYDNHDLNYYGNDVRLSDLGKILKVEGKAFWEGLGTNPLQWPFQALYSGATTAVGTLTALDNSLNDILGKGDFSSLKDFFGSVFGESSVNPQDLGIMNIAAGGCMPEVPALPGQSAPGTGSGAPGSGAPPAKGQAGAPDGNASGAGKDGILITTKQGNPTAELAALDAKFKAENQQALEKAQAEERARQEKAEKEKAASKEKDSQRSTPALNGNDKGEVCSDPQIRPLTDEERKLVDARIEEIEKSKFGQTEEGRKIVAKLKDMQQNGKIVHADACANGAASFDPSTGLMRLEDNGLKGSQIGLGGQLVHEGTHAVDNDQFPQHRNAIPDEARAYENGALYESEKGGNHRKTDVLLNSRNRSEFESAIKKDELYKDNANQRYPDVPEPRPVDENNILYKIPGGKDLYESDKKVFEQNRSAFEQRSAEKEFENDRSKDFENTQKTIQENRANFRKDNRKDAGSLSGF